MGSTETLTAGGGAGSKRERPFISLLLLLLLLGSGVSKMAARTNTEELRARARAAGLSPAEEGFVCFDWAASEAWQEYLSNLYPTPPLNKLLKWKKKFYKTHQVGQLLLLPRHLPTV